MTADLATIAGAGAWRAPRIAGALEAGLARISRSAVPDPATTAYVAAGW